MKSEQTPRTLVRRRTVARRVLIPYTIMMTGFALVAGWSVIAQRTAYREADLMRSGYLPLSLALRDLVAVQDSWNTQLNHTTTARNPRDQQLWFETALRIVRPKKYAEVRARISRALIGTGYETVDSVGRELLSETVAIESEQHADRDDITGLFDALERGNSERAERLRDRLVKRGSQSQRRISTLEQRIQRNIDALLDAARARERLALQLLIALAVLTALVGIGMALYAQRVLQPLAAVTARAKAVAEGDLTPRPVVGSDDEIGELAATFESMVSAIARASEQLLAAERLATIGKMAAHVTHEIRNPLSSMGLNVDLLEEELAGDTNDEAKALLRAIKQEIERLSNLSTQYLSVARRRPSTLEDEDLGEVVADAVDFVRRDLERHCVAVSVDVGDALPRVMIDVAQVKQALYNLLRNAREAMPNGGQVSLVVRSLREGGVELLVEDEGKGIDDASRERLFDPFFTTKGSGTGLGLAITRQIVEAHGGTITCEPREPRGTRFSIRLPGTPTRPDGELDRVVED